MTAPGGGKLVNWKSDRPINAVILRSGQDAAVYEYEPPDYSATGLMPPCATEKAAILPRFSSATNSMSRR